MKVWVVTDDSGDILRAFGDEAVAEEFAEAAVGYLYVDGREVETTMPAVIAEWWEAYSEGAARVRTRLCHRWFEGDPLPTYGPRAHHHNRGGFPALYYGYGTTKDEAIAALKAYRTEHLAKVKR